LGAELDYSHGKNVIRFTTISIIMSTARDDYPLLGLPKTHIFEPLVSSLNRQSFHDFELVIVDSLYEDRDTGPLDEATFHVKRVPPKQSPWLDAGMFHSANNFNTGLIHAEGELIVKIDDCMELEGKDHLKTVWDWYNQGFIPLQTYKYYFKGEPAVYSETIITDMLALGNFTEDDEWFLRMGWSDEVYAVGEAVKDTRLKHFNIEHKTVSHEWYYGVSSTPIKDALDVNGYDEAMDGCRGLLDLDFGSRLEMKGCNPFVLDRSLMLIEHLNDSLSPKVIKRQVNFLDKHAIYNLNREKNRYRANEQVLSDEDIEYIKRKSETFDPYWFDFWVKNQRTFNLRELRLGA